MSLRKSAWWVCCLWLAAAPVLAATPAAQTPEQAVMAYMTALQTEGMAVVPAHLHPDELARFKEMLMPLFRHEPTSEKKELTEGLFGAGATLASIEAMPGAELMAALFKVVGKELEGIKFESLEMLGSVKEGEIVHVVSRIGVAGPKGMQMKMMEVVSVKPYKNEWKLMLTGELEGLAAAMSAQ